MSLPVCKLFRSAIVCGDKREISTIRSACGKNYEFLFDIDDKESVTVLCQNVGLTAKCSNGHSLFFYTDEFRMFAHTKPCVWCRICGDIIFLHDVQLECIAKYKNCKH